MERAKAYATRDAASADLNRMIGWPKAAIVESQDGPDSPVLYLIQVPGPTNGAPRYLREDGFVS